jgi:large subunit ribosomal protein L1
VKEVKAGRVEFRVDRQSNVAIAVAKISFEESKIIDNVRAFIDAVMRAKPAAAKGSYLLSASICTTMSPGIKLDYTALVADFKR